jgi:putative ABC transport system permease protein
MTHFLLIFKSAFRNRLRALLTSVGVGIAMVAFLTLRTFLGAWNAGVESAASDRLITRNKISITFPMPLSYIDKIKQIVGDGGKVGYENWFGAVYPKDEHGFFANLAADDEIFALYPEIDIAPADMQAWHDDRQGAVVGPHLAEKYGWKVGDKITLRGTIYPGNWDFNVRAIYHARTKAIDESSFFFHWKYFNESVNARLKDQVGIIAIKIDDPSKSAAIANTIDKTFASSLAETRTESEKAFQLEFLSMASTILRAIRIISYVVLVILMLILANTMAMATRERTTEYAVMRAIGFTAQQIVTMVIAEGLIIALVGAAFGIALSVPILTFFGQALEKKMGGFLGNLVLDADTIVVALVVALNLGWIAAALPARRAGRLKIVDALRRVE